MEQIGVVAPGAEHELDTGNQTPYQHIDGRRLYRAGGTAVGHRTEIIAVGRKLLVRGWSMDYLLGVRKRSHHSTGVRSERQV